jgi:hypothetical protein
MTFELYWKITMIGFAISILWIAGMLIYISIWNYTRDVEPGDFLLADGEKYPIIEILDNKSLYTVDYGEGSHHIVPSSSTEWSIKKRFLWRVK